MRPDIKKILLETDLCVLCTSSNDVPDASLMLYACDEGCESLLMLSLRQTDKVRNILHNPNVSVLVDTRAAPDGGAGWTRALTIAGEASVVDDPAASAAWVERLAARHGGLSNLAADESVCVIRVGMKRILYLESVDKGSDITL